MTYILKYRPIGDSPLATPDHQVYCLVDSYNLALSGRDPPPSKGAAGAVPSRPRGAAGALQGRASQLAGWNSVLPFNKAILLPYYFHTTIA